MRIVHIKLADKLKASRNDGAKKMPERPLKRTHRSKKNRRKILCQGRKLGGAAILTIGKGEEGLHTKKKNLSARLKESNYFCERESIKRNASATPRTGQKKKQITSHEPSLKWHLKDIEINLSKKKFAILQGRAKENADL